MIPAPALKDEKLRLQALHALNLTSASPDARLDYIVEFAAHTLKAPIGLITLIDEDHQWFIASHGINTTGTSRDISFCGHAICDISNGVVSDRVFEITDSKKDIRFFDNPLVVESPWIRSYISYVLKTDCGMNIGTLCIIDNVSREFTDINKQMLKLLGSMVENILLKRHHLDGIKHKFD